MRLKWEMECTGPGSKPSDDQHQRRSGYQTSLRASRRSIVHNNYPHHWRLSRSVFLTSSYSNPANLRRLFVIAILIKTAPPTPPLPPASWPRRAFQQLNRQLNGCLRTGQTLWMACRDSWAGAKRIMRNTTARAPAVKYIYLSSGLLHHLPQYTPQMVQGCQMSSFGNDSDQAVSTAGVKFHGCFPYRALKSDLPRFNSRRASYKL